MIGAGGFLSFTTGLLRTVGIDTINCLAVRGGAGVRLTVVWVLTDCID